MDYIYVVDVSNILFHDEKDVFEHDGVTYYKSHATSKYHTCDTKNLFEVRILEYLENVDGFTYEECEDMENPSTIEYMDEFKPYFNLCYSKLVASECINPKLAICYKKSYIYL